MCEDEKNNDLKSLSKLIGLPIESTKRASGFINILFREPVMEFSEMFKDHVRYLRFKNQVRILNKAKDYLDNSVITPKDISLKILVPLIEYSSLEEDESMQNKWAALLANAVKKSNEGESIVSYIHLLNELSPKEAMLIDLLYNIHIEIPMIYLDSYKEEILDTLKIKEETLYVYIDNLMRLKILETNYREILNYLKEKEQEDEDRERYRRFSYNPSGYNDYNYYSPISTKSIDHFYAETMSFTNYGKRFVEVCKFN